ncbi:hypothetical protein ABKN59_010483 [Abortiporus biennis]
MPQIYDLNRRHSSFQQSSSSSSNTTRPHPPRRTTTILPPPQREGPEIRDVDDSIVLSDLVRTGEASRLRRRGAMRLDNNHTHHRSTSSSSTSNLNPSSNALLNSYPINMVRQQPLSSIPVRPSTPPWALPTNSANTSSTSAAGLDDFGDPDPYLAPVNPADTEWRDWINVNLGPGAEGSLGSSSSTVTGGIAEVGQGTIPNNNTTDKDEKSFVLFCGGSSLDGSESEDDDDDDYFCPTQRKKKRFEQSLFPTCCPSSSHHTHTRKHHISRPSKRPRPSSSNGCGAVLHFRAYPQKTRGVWVAKEEANTEVVIGMDPKYFDRDVVAKMMKSACGCVREGIGCSVCGNTLGTRYLPCQAASEGLFSTSRHSSNNTPHHHHSHPIRPSGPSYHSPRFSPTWNTTTDNDKPGGKKFYVYTFFADKVSSSPTYDEFDEKSTYFGGTPTTTTTSNIGLSRRRQTIPDLTVAPAPAPGGDGDGEEESQGAWLIDNNPPLLPPPNRALFTRSPATMTSTPLPPPPPSQPPYFMISNARRSTPLPSSLPPPPSLMRLTNNNNNSSTSSLPLINSTPSMNQNQIPRRTRLNFDGVEEQVGLIDADGEGDDDDELNSPDKVGEGVFLSGFGSGR